MSVVNIKYMQKTKIKTKIPNSYIWKIMVKEQHLSHQFNLDLMTIILILLCDANVNVFYILQCSGAPVLHLETDPVVCFNPFFPFR